jgi:hypothetical protein
MELVVIPTFRHLLCDKTEELKQFTRESNVLKGDTLSTLLFTVQITTNDLQESTRLLT